MKKVHVYFFVAVLFLLQAFTYAENYKQVKIRLQNPAVDVAALGQLNFDVEHCVLQNKNELILFISENEERLLQASGYQYEILIADWMEYFKTLPKMTDAEVRRVKSESKEKYNVEGFGYGSFAGYYSLNEVYQNLDSMKTRFPNLITTKFVIGTTVENRPLYAVKISDNPDVNEAEPEVLYTALHHAREPAGMMTVMYYMYYLLENYASDPAVKYLVDNRQIYFVPVVNPDGYEYNRTTTPSGGGMWRKNRKNNGGGTYGIDLNRNYGPMNYWNANNGGSSTSPSDDTYRGTAPFSENETSALRDFVNSHKFKTALNYHTYSNLLIYPYGALGQETPDSAIFREFASDMTAFNGYEAGTDMQTVGYSTRGNSDDFMYDGDLTNRGKVLAMTPEVGGSSDGFWPSQSRIFPLAIENLKPNLYYTYVAGEYISLKNVTYSQQYVNPGDQVQMNFTLKNKGLSAGYNLQLQLTSLSQYATVLASSVSVDSIPARGSYQASTGFSFRIAPNAPIQEKVKFLLKTYTGSSLMSADTVSLVLGTPSFVFRDTTAAPSALWNVTGSPTSSPVWDATTSSYFSAPNSFTDSKNGSYVSNATVTMIMKNAVDLTGLANPVLSFMTKWDIETKWDCGVVSLSTNNGSTWIALAGQYTKPGSGSGTQVANVPCYDGTKADWVKEEISLASYVGKQIKLKFELKTDGSEIRDGWYLDDIGIFTYVQPVQVTWASAISIKDAGNTQGALTLGLSPVASNGIDAQLGEITLPPLPPSGVFDVRFELPVTPAEFSVKDYRRDTLSSTSWKLMFQPGLQGYPVTLSWDAAQLPAGTFILKDGITGTIYNVNMKNQSSLIVDNAAITSLIIEYSKQSCKDVTIQSGWNLVSVPVIASNMGASALFPQATSPLYGFNNGYVTATDLTNGKGYWVRYGASANNSVCGNAVSGNTVALAAGWNLVGVYGSEVQSSQITTNPSGIINSVFYGYNAGYAQVSALLSGKGYWVRASQAGTMVLPAGGAKSGQPAETVADTKDKIAITITDAANNTATLFSGSNENTISADLPPAPPAGIFDARFIGDKAMSNLGSKRGTISVQSAQFPVTISVGVGSFKVTDVATNGKMLDAVVSAGNPVVLTQSSVQSVYIEQLGTAAEFTLQQNYPNPFNPATTIRFAIPTSGVVTLRVYNQLGELVTELVNGELEVGAHSVEFNASNLSSGVYLYELKASGIRQVKKLILCK